jgi:ABC-2 type transport system ATP-binding protein
MDILLSSHLLEEVERTCDRAVILAGGEVAVAGTLDELRGVGSGAVVELDDRADEVAAALAAQGLEVARQGGRLEVTSTTMPEEALFDALRDALATNGAALRRLVARRTSLEEVYLRVGSAPSGAPAAETVPTP